MNISIQNLKFKDKMNSADIKQLCKDVEEHAGLHLESKRDYIKLAELISQALNESMSYSTLMRLWGYRISFSHPSAYTLSVLARYCGYDSFTAYCNELHNRGCESAFTLSPLSVLSNSLKVGTLLRLHGSLTVSAICAIWAICNIACCMWKMPNCHRVVCSLALC